MIGYVVLGTNDLPRATDFYDALLAEIGLSRQMDLGGRGYGWGKDADAVMLCVMTPFDGEPATVGNGTMTAIGSPSFKTALPWLAMICIKKPSKGASMV